MLAVLSLCMLAAEFVVAVNKQKMAAVNVIQYCVL
jgi:hypothetical protein